MWLMELRNHGVHTMLATNTDSVYPPCNKAIFPLLKDVVHTVNMQHHLISCFIDYNRTLNTDQVAAVDCSDQPVYALSKICQWFYPAKFGFPMYFPMLGALHIEKALLIVHSKLIGGTDVDAIIGDNRINIIGLQNAVLDVNHIYISRYSLKLCSAALYACLKGAHHKSGSQIDLLPWAQLMASECLMFKYWLTVLQFEIDFLVFLRSIREGNFSLYVVTLRTLIKWFFIFDQYNYARWTSVHVHELVMLPTTCPYLYNEFKKGKFAVQISHRKFSKIHYDHAHTKQQDHKVIKWDN